MFRIDRWFRRQKDVWRQFATEIGAEFIEGERRFWRGKKPDKVSARFKTWTITLETSAESDLYGAQRYVTIMRVPYVGKDGLWFNVYNRPLFTGDMLDEIKVGAPELESRFIIKGGDASKVIALFASDRIRELIEVLPKIDLRASATGRVGVLAHLYLVGGGETELRGFEDPVRLYELRWREAG